MATTKCSVDVVMAARVDTRRERVLNEFGYFTAEQLADANCSRASDRHALASNWKRRRRVFSVPLADSSGHLRQVFPRFQFENGKPLAAVRTVVEAFGPDKDAWKLALWFASNNGWLPGQARPADLLQTLAGAVLQAAQRDGVPSDG